MAEWASGPWPSGPVLDSFPAPSPCVNVVSDGLLLRLQTVLRGTPPPWLRKALNKGHERTLNLEDEVVHG